MASKPSSATSFTVDELARRAGTLTTTVRMYQHRGLLMGPNAKRGRVALYGPEHLERLALVADLQARGHSLAGIKELLDGWAGGGDLDRLLGLSTWGAPRPVTMPMTALLERFGMAPLTQEDLQRAARLGLLEVDGTEVRVADARFLDAGAELVALGVPVSAVLDEWVWLRKRADAVARRFTALFERHLWPRYRSAATDPKALAELRAVLERLGPLAGTVTGLALEEALRASASEFVDAHVPPQVEGMHHGSRDTP